MKKYICLAITLCLGMGMLSSVSVAGVKLLSDANDINNVELLDAIKHRDEATAFWGAGNVLGGNKKAAAVTGAKGLSAIRSFAAKNDQFFDAAFLMAVKDSEQIKALAESRSPADTSLAAAACCLQALIPHLAEERAKETVAPPEHLAGDMKKSSKRGGSGKKKGTMKGNADLLSSLLASQDTATQYYAIQAAAYGRLKGVAEAVAAIEARKPEIAAAQLLYRAMTGAGVTPDEVMAVAQAALQASSRVRTREFAPDFNINVTPMSLVCQAIGELKQAESVPILGKASMMGDVRIQMDALRAMRKVASEEALPAVNAIIPKCAWPVLVDACATAGAIPSEKMVPVLIQRLSGEKGRFRMDLVHALSAIAGEQHGADAEEWTAWWRANGQSFKVDPAAAKKYRTSTRVQDVDVPSWGFFYGLNIFSDRMCYVIDSSLSMKGPRIASLKENLVDSIASLAPHVMFNLVDFGGDIEVLYDGALTSNKGSATRRVEEMDMSLATRSFCALRQGMAISEVDSIYFLSDGSPARDSMANWTQIQQAVVTMTRYCPVALYSIDFDPSPQAQAAMTTLAFENVGNHETVNP